MERKNTRRITIVPNGRIIQQVNFFIYRGCRVRSFESIPKIVRPLRRKRQTLPAPARGAQIWTGSALSTPIIYSPCITNYLKYHLNKSLNSYREASLCLVPADYCCLGVLRQLVLTFIETPVCCARGLRDFCGECSRLAPDSPNFSPASTPYFNCSPPFPPQQLSCIS
jgi:hypothetical protein